MWMKILQVSTENTAFSGEAHFVIIWSFHFQYIWKKKKKEQKIAWEWKRNASYFTRTTKSLSASSNSGKLLIFVYEMDCSTDISCCWKEPHWTLWAVGRCGSGASMSSSLEVSDKKDESILRVNLKIFFRGVTFTCQSKYHKASFASET